MLSEKNYIKYYHEKGKTVDQISISNNTLNEQQLLSKYKKYVVKENKKYNKKVVIDEKWIETKRLVNDRDKGKCQLMNKLPNDVIYRLVLNSAGYYKTLDPAHRLGKGAYPKLKYVVENVYTLNRYSHSMLDSRKHPIYGYIISKEEHNLWWRIISGEIDYKENLWQET